MIAPKSNKLPSNKLSSSSASTYFDPESLVSFTLQSNVKKSINSKSTPCLTQQQQASLSIGEDKMIMPKSKRKSTINWPFRRSNSNSAIKQQSSSPQQTSSSKTVTSMLHKKLLSKSQNNLKNNVKSNSSSGVKQNKSSKTLSIMSNVTLKRSSNKKQTIKLFGQSINKLCLGDRHLITPVKVCKEIVFLRDD